MNSRRYGTHQQLSFERKTLSKQKIRELVLQKWWLLVLNMTAAGKKLRKVIASMIRRRPSMTLLPLKIIFLYKGKPSERLDSKVFHYCTIFALKNKRVDITRSYNRYVGRSKITCLFCFFIMIANSVISHWLKTFADANKWWSLVKLF